MAAAGLMGATRVMVAADTGEAVVMRAAVAADAGEAEVMGAMAADLTAVAMKAMGAVHMVVDTVAVADTGNPAA
jgi:hypothetical protein